MEGAPLQVTPKEVNVKIPSKGTPDEAFEMTIHNPTPHKMFFKVKSTKPLFFHIEPTCGAIDSCKSTFVKVQPVKNVKSDNWTKIDHFSVLWAKAPAGDLYLPEDVFTKGKDNYVKEPKTLQIPLHAASHIVQPSDGTPIPEISCKLLVIRFPTRPDHMKERVVVTNTSKHRLAFQVKCTKRPQFSISDEFGWIEPGRHANIDIAPVLMEINQRGKNEIGLGDHFIIKTTVAPKDDSLTAEKIFTDKLCEEAHTHVHKIAIEIR